MKQPKINDTLFEPFQLTPELTLQNRIIMAPMTRVSAHDDHSPTEEMSAYYARRAAAGLIITEGTIIAPNAKGNDNVPGIYTDAQIKAWQGVTDAVHEEGGRIFSQLWHVGRVSHPNYLNGELPVAPSAVPMQGEIPRNRQLNYGMPRALRIDEIPNLISSYAQAAENAINAGFDGVELHGANGYLIDQFLHHHTNRRNDEYGGSVENMSRFALEVVDTVGKKIGYHRLGIRLSPGAYLSEMEGHCDDASVFQHLLKQLESKEIAYVHAGIFDDSTHFDYLDGTVTQFLRRNYGGTLIASGSYTPESAAEAMANGSFDLIAIGRPFIANPDLIQKLDKGEEPVNYQSEMLEKLY